MQDGIVQLLGISCPALADDYERIKIMKMDFNYPPSLTLITDWLWRLLKGR